MCVCVCACACTVCLAVCVCVCVRKCRAVCVRACEQTLGRPVRLPRYRRTFVTGRGIVKHGYLFADCVHAAAPRPSGRLVAVAVACVPVRRRIVKIKQPLSRFLVFNGPKILINNIYWSDVVLFLLVK